MDPDSPTKLLCVLDNLLDEIAIPEFATRVKLECTERHVRRQSSPTFVKFMHQVVSHAFMPSVGPVELRGKTDTNILIGLLRLVITQAPIDKIVSVVRFGSDHMFIHNATAHQHFLKLCRRMATGNLDLLSAMPRLTATDKAIRNARASARLDVKMTTPIEVEYDMVMSALGSAARDSTSFHCMWIGIQLATGCRMTEVVSVDVAWAMPSSEECASSELGKCTGLADPTRYIKQTGSVKVGSRCSYIRPLIGPMDCQFYIDAIAHVRECVHRPSTLTNTEVNTRHHRTLNRLVDSMFVPQRLQAIDAGLAFGTHFLRACWVNVLFHENRDKCGVPSMTKFMQLCLGHVTTTSARHYEAVRLVVGRPVPHGDAVAKHMRLVDDTRDPTPLLTASLGVRPNRGDTPFLTRNCSLV
jgi:hypothetical protein